MRDTRRLEILAIGPESNTADIIRRVGENLEPGVNVRFSTDLGFDSASPPDVVFVNAEMLARDPVTNAPSLSVFGDAEVYVLVKKAEVDSLRELMKSGARDVWENPVDEELLARELASIGERKAKRLENGAGRLLAFTNAKGGAGTSTIAVNLAHDLAERQEQSVLLVDMDIQFGDVASFLDMKPASSFIEALAQSRRLDGTLLRSIATAHDSGLHAIAAPRRPANIAGVDVEDLRRFLEIAVLSYDFVVLDIPRVLVNWTREALRWSDLYFLVLQGGISELRNARMLLDDLERAGISADHLRAIHNRHGTRHASTSVESMCKVLRVDEMHEVRSDYAAASKAENAGRPVAEIAHGSSLVRDIRALSGEILKICDRAPVKKVSRLRSMFSRAGRNS